MIGWVVVGAVAAGVALGVAANSRWAARRGWVYNKHNPRPPGAGMPPLLDEIYQPAIEHVIDERSSEAIRSEQDESGEGGD